MPGGRSHHSIVSFYEIYEVDSQFQLVMEYVDGKNAHDWLAELEGPLPIAERRRRSAGTCSQALDFAHSRGYVHRDVKPSNLLIFGPLHRPRVKLTDFGLAKSFAETEGLTSLTRQGDIGGSIGFISPEHIRQFQRNPRARRHLQRRRDPVLPFDRQIPLSRLRPPRARFLPDHPPAPPLPLRAFRPDAPEGLERILLKALQKQPRDRWKSAGAMASALRAFSTPSSM